MKKTIIIFLTMAILVGGGLYFWIQGAKKTAKTPTTPATNSKTVNNAPGATEKSGTTTKTGKITVSGGVYSLQEAGQTAKEIDSYVVDLSKYVNQIVTVTGQYSGDTLFVGAVK